MRCVTRILFVPVFLVSAHFSFSQDGQVTFLNESDASLDAVGDPLPTGALMRFGTHRLQHPESVNSMVVSPDDQCVVSLGYNNLICWDAVTGKELWRRNWSGSRISGPAYGQRFLCFAGKDPDKLFTCDNESNVVIWNLKDGTSTSISTKRQVDLANLFAPSRVKTKSIDVTQDGNLLLLGGQSGIGLYSKEGHEKWFLPNLPSLPCKLVAPIVIDWTLEVIFLLLSSLQTENLLPH